MNKSYEDFEFRTAIDAIIRCCREHNDSLSDTIMYVQNQFSNADENYIETVFWEEQ